MAPPFLRLGFLPFNTGSSQIRHFEQELQHADCQSKQSCRRLLHRCWLKNEAEMNRRLFAMIQHGLTYPLTMLAASSHQQRFDRNSPRIGPSRRCSTE